MKAIIQTAIIILTITFLIRCFTNNFKEKIDEKFGDQHFKTAIALIERYKVREGRYHKPLDSLNEIAD
jgi:hypothetical protein